MEAATLPLLGRENRVQHPTMEFDDFYRREFTGLVVLAAAVTGERQGAEDIVQESMLDAHRRWDRIGSYDSPRGWVRRVVIQRALKWSRRRLNEGRAVLRSVAGGRIVSGAEDRRDPDLLEALRSLPAKQRAAMALHYLEDASVADTAEMLGVSTGTVKTHLSRGRRQLAGLLRIDADDAAEDGAADGNGRP